MKLLITGINGFVGRNLVEDLSSKHEIYGLDITSCELPGVIATFGWDEIENFKSLSFDVIIHLAGKAHDVKKNAKPEEYFEINTGLTKNIFDFFRESRVSRFIFFSSVKAAADYVPGDTLTEDISPRPVGPYGESKIAAENYIMDNLNDFPESFKSKYVYILRPCMIHGPGNKGNLNLLFSILKKGIPWPLGAYENRRSFTSIENLKYIIDGLVEKKVETGIYNVADDEALSTNELVRAICEAIGKKCLIIKCPKKLIKFAALLGDKLCLPINTERLEKLTENYVVSNNKLKKALKIESMPVSALQGIERTVKSL
ncbi:MAG: NAD-dependent epimerase/dehydratase family protein [Rikenellaceae bacterium]|nr:NAD-dependent epimerase/dehydratase family protein [Rikenellaceae bacterium]